MDERRRVAVLGAGKMGEALLSGMLRGGPRRPTCSSRRGARSGPRSCASGYGVEVVSTPRRPRAPTP